MSTNYYAHVLPSKERKEELKKLIDADDFLNINKEIKKTYGNYQLDYDSYKPQGGIIHLGSRRGGWKFLWNPNIILMRDGHSEYYTDEDGRKRSKYIEDPDIADYLYPLTKKGIKDFIDREDITIVDEYWETIDKEDFWKMALEWEKDGWDAAAYEKDYPNNRNYYGENEYTRLLEREGFKFTSSSCHDFYSDGLRFAAFNEFR